MAIRFDDRIETNVDGDALIIGEQIKVGADKAYLNISSGGLLINDKEFRIDGTKVAVDRLDALPDAIDRVNEHIINITTNIADFISKDIVKIDIDTTTKYFGDELKISTATDLKDYIRKVNRDFNTKPLITFLSSPIVFSTNLKTGNIIYGTNVHPFGDPSIKMLPKNTLVYLFSNDVNLRPVKGVDDLGVSTYVDVLPLCNFMKVLSIPVSADDIHNDFEIRISSIENSLALKN